MYVALFNERETPLRAVAGDTEIIIGPNGCFTEILVRYYTNKGFWKLPYKVGWGTWDTDAFPPKGPYRPEPSAVISVR